MRVPRPGGAGLSVIKVGGSLARLPGALERVSSALGAVARQHPLVVVPGGGPWADAVRDFDRQVGVAPETAHRMAILAMDQYAQVLAERIPGAVLVEEASAIPDVVRRGKAAILVPSRWLRSADSLPPSWAVTSDSIAAYLAGVLGARLLVLIKPTEQGSPVDSYFDAALPADLPYAILRWDRIEDLASLLSGSTAAGAPG